MQKSISIIISVAVIALLGVVLVSILADNTIKSTQLKVQSDTVSIASARMSGGNLNATYKIYKDATNSSSVLTYPVIGTWKNDYTDCAITTISLKNSTGSVMPTTNYSWSTEGNSAVGYLLVKNVESLNNSVSNTTTVTYTYCGDDYVAQSWQRTVLNLVPGFFALAILLGAAFVIFYVLKSEGIVLSP